MKYPLIILGAGASYDLLDENDHDDPVIKMNLRQWKPPLTNDLFEGARFGSLRSKYNEMSDVVSLVRGYVNDGEGFEQALNKIKKMTENDEGLFNSLMSLKFYLSDLFDTISKEYYMPENNYKTLILRINQLESRALIVNFNYDLLLENCLGMGTTADLSKYVKDDIKVIKIHGACNWYYSRRVNSGNKKTSSYELSVLQSQEHIETDYTEKDELIIKNDVTDPRTLGTTNWSDVGTAISYRPALALPLFNKDSYVCPDEHIKLLKKELQRVDCVISIGWKFADQFMIDLLVSETKKRDLPIKIISGTNAEAINESLPESLKKNVATAHSFGFSDFINKDNAFVTILAAYSASISTLGERKNNRNNTPAIITVTAARKP